MLDQHSPSHSGSTKKKTRPLFLRFWIVTFLHGVYCKLRWGKEIMSLYLHNIWIHWPLQFDKLEFVKEETDSSEAWLATLKRILRYNTDRKKEHALLELVLRTSMEEFLLN